MFTDFLGACLNLTHLAGSDSYYRLEFVDDSDDALDLSGCTFSGTVTAVSDGTVYKLGVAASEASTNILGLSFPELALGNYTYELMATDDSGDSQRIVYGQLLVMTTSLDLSNDEGSIYKTLQVREPGNEARTLQLRWLSTSIAQLSAEEAVAARDGIEETISTAVSEATETINSVVEEAQASITAAADEVDSKIAEATELVESAQSAVDTATETLSDATEFMRDYEDKIRASIYIDSDSGTWVIGGVDTGYYASGTSGKSPYLSTSGTWVVYDDATSSWVDSNVSAAGEDGKSPYINSTGTWVVYVDGSWTDTGVQAQGVDGVDGDTVIRIVVDAYDDIPQSGETCTGGYYYYIDLSADRDNGDATGQSNWVYAQIAGSTFRAGTYTALTLEAATTSAAAMSTDEVYLGIYHYLEVVAEDEETEEETAEETEPTYAWQLVAKSSEAVACKGTEDTTWPFDGLVLDGETDFRILPLLDGQDETWPIDEDFDADTLTMRSATADSDGSSYLMGRTGTTSPVFTLDETHAPAFRLTPDETGYEVYAWVEDTDGNGSWAKVGETYDLATSTVYGIVKLGTDVTATDGAPVGTNASGQLTVPLADYTTPGSARLSASDTLEEDTSGAIGLDADGRMRAQSARADRFGSMKHSTSEQTETDCVGLNEDGTTGIRWAANGVSGVVALGTQWEVSNPRPYLVTIGMNPSHEIVHNTLYGGALRHWMAGPWTTTGMEWLEQYAGTEYFSADEFYTGILTTDQFTQTEDDGLVLLTATTTKLAGVYLATGLDDTRENAVPNASQVTEGIAVETEAREAADTAEAETREAADDALSDRIDALSEATYTQAEVAALLTQLTSDLTDSLKAWVVAQGYDTVTDVDSKLTNYMKTTETVTEVQALTTEEFNNLESRDDTTLYLN